jgi:hypothetical protein
LLKSGIATPIVFHIYLVRQLQQYTKAEVRKMKKSTVPSGLRFAKTLAVETCERDSGRFDVRENSSRKTPPWAESALPPPGGFSILDRLLRHG